MALFYTVKDNKVSNILVAENKSDAEAATSTTCYEYTEDNAPHIGWDFDGTSFVKPSPPAPREVFEAPPAL
jgi:hypothetical protein